MILGCFCTHTRQHRAKAPTLTKLWQGQQKSRFFTYRQHCTWAKKRCNIAPKVFQTELPTKIVRKTDREARRARFWTGLGPCWHAFWRSWAAPGSSWAPVGRLLGASWPLLAVSRLVSGAPWPHVGVQKRLGPRFWKLLRRARLGFARLLANVLNLCLLQLLGCEELFLDTWHHLYQFLFISFSLKSFVLGPSFSLKSFVLGPSLSLKFFVRALAMVCVFA